MVPALGVSAPVSRQVQCHHAPNRMLSPECRSRTLSLRTAIPMARRVPTNTTRRLARVVGGQALLLPAPGAAGTPEARDAFYDDPYVSQTLALARQANLAFMGVGAPRADSILVQEGNIVSWPELEALMRQGAVGDINLRYYDAEGQSVPSDLDERVIGLTLDEIRAIDTVVGVAGGAAKLQAIQGALQGQLVDVLVTDHVTAQQLLQAVS